MLARLYDKFVCNRIKTGVPRLAFSPTLACLAVSPPRTKRPASFAPLPRPIVNHDPVYQSLSVISLTAQTLPFVLAPRVRTPSHTTPSTPDSTLTSSIRLPPRAATYHFSPDFSFSPATKTSRTTFRRVQQLFVDIEQTTEGHPLSRFGAAKAPVPPDTRPDPRKCRPGDREVVRELFNELKELRRRSLGMAKGDIGREDASEVVESSEREMISEIEEEGYNEILKYEAGGAGVVHVKRGQGYFEVREGAASDYISNDVTDRISNGAYDAKHSHDHHRYCGRVCEEGVTETECQGDEVGEYSEQMPEEEDYREAVTEGVEESEYHDEAMESEYNHEHVEEAGEAEANGRGSVASSEANSFDQVAMDIAKDLDVFDRVDDQDLRDLAAQMPERNHDRLLSEEASVMQGGGEVFEEHHHHEQNAGEEHHHHHHHHYYYDEDEGGDDGERTEPATNRYPDGNDDGDSMPGPPPSFIFRTERLSKNVAEAMAGIWDRFWAEDVRQISRIIKNRFSQLMPYIRRFLAHLVAFWGGINYIRRALTAFVRILNRDTRVRELLERVGWATTTTLRVFLSICAMVMQATLQMYYLIRDRIIPDARRVIPILYYKAILKLLQAAEHSPWSLVLGPFSLTFAIDASKLPDRFYLHTKLGVPYNDVTFANGGMHTFVQSVRETLNRSRARYGSQESSPVHSQTTDELPFPPPASYSVSGAGGDGMHHRRHHQHHHHTHSGKRGKGNRGEPLTECTNVDGC